jgi:hypothetical protein
MAFQRTAGICLWLVITSAIAYGQPQSDTSTVTPQVGSTVLLPSVNEPARETTRTKSTVRQIGPEVIRHDDTLLARDINGRWRAVEIRQGEVRRIGTSERVEQETVQRPDLNGHMIVEEVHVIRSSSAKGREQVEIETYSPQIDVHSFTGRPPLSARVRRTTTSTANGGSYTVEEREERSPVSANDPMRVVQRIVTTVSPGGPDEWVTERRIFELDVNGRLRLAGE